MDVSHVPEILCRSERASHLARAAHDLLMLPLPPEALPALARMVYVIESETSSSADELGDMLGCSVHTPEAEGPVDR